MAKLASGARSLKATVSASTLVTAARTFPAHSAGAKRQFGLRAIA